VYFDNESVELYHGRLDKKPNAIALRIRWCARAALATGFARGRNLDKEACAHRAVHSLAGRGPRSSVV
jgi:SPX domain protein involved in polyphosphate accumulation